MKIIDILKWLFLLTAVVSGSSMSSIARAEKAKSKWFASVFDLLDYIEISRQKNGKIGSMFWLFLVSVIAFFALLIVPKL